MTTPARPRLRVALANDFEIVVAGLAGMLAAYDDRVEVVDLAVRRPPTKEVDVVLYDPFGRAPHEWHVRELVGRGAPIIVFTWTHRSEVITDVLAAGAVGVVSKGATGDQLVEALESAHAGRTVVLADSTRDLVAAAFDWPARDAQLSAREAEILALIARGLSNQEIADRCYLSINSVKSYVRNAYRKIGVQRRAQAVAWAVEHGMSAQPDWSEDYPGTG